MVHFNEEDAVREAQTVDTGHARTLPPRPAAFKDPPGIRLGTGPRLDRRAPNERARLKGFEAQRWESGLAGAADLRPPRFVIAALCRHLEFLHFPRGAGWERGRRSGI